MNYSKLKDVVIFPQPLWSRREKLYVLQQIECDSSYASVTQTTALLRSGVQYRRDRMEAVDMVTTNEAAELAGTSRVTINAWIKSGRCIGVSNLRHDSTLPR